jgi:hypothetical protein
MTNHNEVADFEEDPGYDGDTGGGTRRIRRGQPIPEDPSEDSGDEADDEGAREEEIVRRLFRPRAEVPTLTDAEIISADKAATALRAALAAIRAADYGPPSAIAIAAALSAAYEEADNNPGLTEITLTLNAIDRLGYEINDWFKTWVAWFYVREAKQRAAERAANPYPDSE